MTHKETEVFHITVNLNEPETWGGKLIELKDAAERLEVLLTEKKIHDSGR